MPIIKILDKMKITANMLDFFSFLIIIPVFFVVKDSPLTALILYFVSMMLIDFIDGPLARYQKKNNDLGKFIDYSRDLFVTALFLIAVINAGYFDVFQGMLYVVLMILYNVSTAIYKGTHTKSDWFFYTSSTFLSNTFLFVLPVVFAVNIFYTITFTYELLIISNIIMTVGTVYYIFKIIRYDGKEEFERSK